MSKITVKVFALLFCSFCMMSMFSNSYATGKMVNIEGLKAIEEEDDFGVRITEKELEYDTGLSINGNDLILLTISNFSSDLIRDITVYVVLYNENIEQTTAGISFTTPNGPEVYEAQSIDIGLDGWKTLSISCAAEDLKGVRAIIASYTNMDGLIVENNNASTWCNSLYKGETSEKKVLD